MALERSLGQKRQAAFSLIELLLAFSIIATALLLIIGIFTNVIQSSQKSVDLTAGTILAEYLMDAEMHEILSDKARRDSFFDNDFPMSAGNAYAMGTAATLNQTVFSYVIYNERVEPFTTPGNRLKKVDVVVWWWRPGGAGEFTVARQGYGYLRTQMSRLVNERSRN